MIIHVLVVDDEPFIAAGVTQMIKELQEYEIEIENCCSSEEALRISREQNLDLMIVDIEMPKMNGLELVEQLAREGRHTRIIFLTGYSNYEYMRRALQQNVCDYVLKLKGMKALRDSVVSVLQKIESENRSDIDALDEREQWNRERALLEGALIRDVITGKAESHDLMEHGIRLQKEKPILVMAALDSTPGAGRYKTVLMSMRVCQYIRKEIDEPIYSVPLSDNACCWILQDPEQPDCRELARRVNFLLEKLVQLMMGSFGCRLHFALTEESIAFEEATNAYERLIRRATLYMDDPSVYLGSGVGIGGRPHVLQSEWEKLENSLVSGDRRKFSEVFTRLLEMLSDDEAKNILPAWFYMLGNILVRYMMSFENEEQRREIREIADLLAGQHKLAQSRLNELKEMSQKIFSLTDKLPGRQSNNIVIQIQRYVDTHLNGDLSLSTLSGIVHLNASYLSRLFRRTCGCTFSDYIVMVRVEKAKVLLTTTDMKIQDIALTVGLENAPYFSTIFKRETGLSPQKFRDTFAHISSKEQK